MPYLWRVWADPDPVVNISDRVRFGFSVTTNAEEGSVAMSTISVDDPDGDLDIIGLKRLIGAEYDVVGDSWAQMFYRGWVADREIGRGETDDTNSNRVLAARRWVVQSADQNSLISRRVLLGTDANRPAETDVARMQYLMTTPEMGFIDNTTYLNTSGPVNMDAVDYRGQYCFDIANDCAQASGKNFWVMWLPELGDVFGLWYDFSTSTAYSSSLRISNVLADCDEVTTFEASYDSKLVRDPHRVYSGVYMQYDGGAVYETLAATATTFQARDTTSDSPNVKSSTKASARAIRYLNSINVEDDRITTTVIVPNSKLMALREGHRVQCKFSHLPGYAGFTWMRVVNRTVTQYSEEQYQLTLEMIAAPGVEAGVCDVFGPTQAGYYQAIGGSGVTPNTDPDGWQGYNTAGHSIQDTWPPIDANTTYVGKWNFPSFQSIASTHGGTFADQVGTGSSNDICVVTIGAGTVVMHLIPGNEGGDVTFSAKMYYYKFSAPVGVTLYQDQGTFHVGTGVDVTFTNPGGPECAYAVVIGDINPAGHKLGWDGFTFTPA